jgi:hypothetical protein
MITTNSREREEFSMAIHSLDKKGKELHKLSGILKGIIVYKKEVKELHRLCDKYPHDIEGKHKILSAYA